MTTPRCNHHGIQADRAHEIEQCVRSTQVDLWSHRISSAVTMASPLSVLQPGVALTRLGYAIQTVDSLGTSILGGKVSRVAGILDRRRRLVQVSAAFPVPELRYTAAHELGHVVLRHPGDTVHRDRPMDPTTWSKDPIEREADYFSACFWMPRKYLMRHFQEAFLTDRFTLNEDTAFALCGASFDSAASHIRSTRDLSIALARARSYNARPIRSLIEVFNVTATAMAIRLEELGLIGSHSAFGLPA